jgi:hypothetical protein
MIKSRNHFELRTPWRYRKLVAGASAETSLLRDA